MADRTQGEDSPDEKTQAVPLPRKGGPGVPVDSRLLKSYPVGSEIQCRVTKVLTAGVEAHPLDAPEVHAFVSRHEWTWLRRVLELSNHAHIGDYFNARVEGY